MSEFRRDLVSKDWIIIAPERAARLRTLLRKKRRPRIPPRKGCPFEDLKKSGNWPPIISSPNEEEWHVAVIPNKYPALVHHQACLTPVAQGPYEFASGIGHHDLVVTRDHRKGFADLGLKDAFGVLGVLQKRYRTLAADRCLLYTSTFMNWGPAAGASLFHPHYQVLTLPIIPPAVQHSLDGSRDYFRRHRRCVHCVTIDYERKTRTRVIGENRGAVAFAPFASREAFEIRIFPRRHLPSFERTPARDLKYFAVILRETLRKVKRYLGDPDLNFFIHTAPLKYRSRYRHYHWHVEVIPKITIPAGFELSTGVEINVVNPDEAAAILRR